MQRYARQRAPRLLAPVRTKPRRPDKQALRLQECLGPAVAPGDAMAAGEVLVEMPCREAAVVRAIQALHLGCPVHRHALARRLAEPASSRPSSLPSPKRTHQRRKVRSLIPSSPAASIWFSSLDA